MTAMSNTLTKAGIISILCAKVGCTKEKGQVIVEAVFETIKTKLEKGETVKLSGFGNFVVRSKRSRAGRNPKTGEVVEITARRVLTFKPSAILRDRVRTEEG